MKTVVHITAHLGGGVGRILSNLAIHSLKQNNIEHIIITLEETENKQFEKICNQNNIKVYLANECDLIGILDHADIVQLDWWHHPLTSEFMIKYLDKIQCRLVIWSHISGISYPYIPIKLIRYADIFIFSTPYSLENEFWSQDEKNHILNNTKVIVSSGLEINEAVNKKVHNEFNIGYVGFLNYSKTHPEFVKYCEAVSDIPNVKFKIVGDKSYGKELIKDVSNSTLLKGKFDFLGYSNDVCECFEQFDVFGYILNPKHYGTAENVLLEAMASGVVPIVLNQGCEKYIVENKVTGLVVNNIDEYQIAVKWLYNNPDKCRILSCNASKYIIDKYHIKNTVVEMNEVYNEIINRPKILHNAKGVIGETPYDWFLSCYKGELNKIQDNAFAETKGSVKHYLKYFVNDIRLRKVVENNESRN
ncbi:glycosyltransferase family 4 protein [Clostridium saccharobutylicum]|uniref:Glycosyl transferases group 1 n=1 Tax=Clostridium saccharobutylicum TaxID=169679 RepID=A0A1S8NIS1_CLOSA|nr:glycosyltransferase [Clostridium saccharobutylicum]OOM16262.1 glycosyl transferases group 1 [Clostridium saccharobutylicum]